MAAQIKGTARKGISLRTSRRTWGCEISSRTSSVTSVWPASRGRTPMRKMRMPAMTVRREAALGERVSQAMMARRTRRMQVMTEGRSG